MTKNTRRHRRMTVMGTCAALISSIALAGCEYVRPTLNAPLEQWNPQYGYRFQNLAPPDEGNSNSLFFVVAFSGGGTRASTLAFGALRELARQRIVWEGQEKRLLDELDVIYALSGGTFTGAYYALFGDRIFKDFEYRFLRKDWESELKARIFKSPSNWIRLWSPYYGRIHIMADLLDEALFDGKTYGDLVQSKKRPGLLIHASDMATLARFEFLQTQFDMMCSDMSQLPIAYASAASARTPAGPEPDHPEELHGPMRIRVAFLVAAGEHVTNFVPTDKSQGIAFLSRCETPPVRSSA